MGISTKNKSNEYNQDSIKDAIDKSLNEGLGSLIGIPKELTNSQMETFKRSLTNNFNKDMIKGESSEQQEKIVDGFIQSIFKSIFDLIISQNSGSGDDDNLNKEL